MEKLTVSRLRPEALHQLVRQRGLDACADLVAQATPAQLTAVLELDLWRAPAPGHDQQFDLDRFGDWLEALVDLGDSTAARTIAAVDRHLVVAGLCRYIRVLDPGIFEPIAQSDDEAPDRQAAMREGDARAADEVHATASSGVRLEWEIGGFIVRARRDDAWDAIVAILIALDAEHGECFHELMRGCRRLSNSRAEVDGLDELLFARDQHLHEVEVAREDRRAESGYVSPADARAFLALARATHPPAAAAPVSLALTDPRAGSLASLRLLMTLSSDRDDALRDVRTGELALLANTLAAGCSVHARSLTAHEASAGAASICNLGLERLLPADVTAIAARLPEFDLISAFKTGWAILYREVSLAAADQAAATLARIDCIDGDIASELTALRRALLRARDAGTPWRACDAVETLAMLDAPVSLILRALLDECPVLPAALTAVLGGQTHRVSADDFEFISTAAQLGAVRTFLDRLGDVLSGA